MHRLSIALFCLATCSVPTICNVAQEPVASDKRIEKLDAKKQLGNLFLKALQTDDRDKYLDCWMQFAQVESQLKELPEGAPRPSSDQLNKMRGYIEDRNDLARVIFPILRRALIKNFGNLDDLVVSDVVPDNVKSKGGQTAASSVDVIFATKEGLRIMYHVDDGILIGDRWYFSDKPDSILTIQRATDKTEVIMLGDYATKEELEKLSKRDSK